MKRHRHRLLFGLLLGAVMTAVGCAPQSTSSSARTTDAPPVAVDIALFGPDTGYVLTDGALLAVKGDHVVARDLPAKGLAAFSAPSEGSVIVAVLAEAGLVVFRSTDSGASWSDLKVPDPGIDIANMAVASSADGSAIVVLARSVSSSNFSSGVAMTSFDAGHTWVVVPAPVAGQVAVVSSRLWLAGGAQHDQLFFSDDGAKWTPAKFPASAASGEVEAVVTPVPVGDGLMVAKTAVSGDDATEVTYTSDDNGLTWSLQAKTSLTNSVVAGMPEPSAGNGANLIVVQNDGNHLYQFGPNAEEPSGLSPNGLGPGMKVIRFAGSAGWALESAGSCKSKEDCSVATAVLSTSDAGQTWNAVKLN